MRQLIYSYSLNLWRKFKEENSEIERWGNESRNGKKQIENYDEEAFMRIQFIL